MSNEQGRIFPEAWIAGVTKHYLGEPKPGYIAPWEEKPVWERESAAAVCEQVRAFIELSEGNTSKLSREQKGRFVAVWWIADLPPLPIPEARLRGRLGRPAFLAAGDRRRHLRTDRRAG